MGASVALLGAAIFNPIATEGPGMMESPIAALVKSTVSGSSTSAAVTKSAASVSSPSTSNKIGANKVTAPNVLQEQGYDFDDSAAAKKEVRTLSWMCIRGDMSCNKQQQQHVCHSHNNVVFSYVIAAFLFKLPGGCQVGG